MPAWEDDETLWNLYADSVGNPSDEFLAQWGVDSEELKELFAEAFLDMDVSPDDRSDARDLWFDWMEEFGYDIDDFDWDSWRDWYESA